MKTAAKALIKIYSFNFHLIFMFTKIYGTKILIKNVELVTSFFIIVIVLFLSKLLLTFIAALLMDVFLLNSKYKPPYSSSIY